VAVFPDGVDSLTYEKNGGRREDSIGWKLEGFYWLDEEGILLAGWENFLEEFYWSVERIFWRDSIGRMRKNFGGILLVG